MRKQIDISSLIGQRGTYPRIGECADRLMSRFEKHGKDMEFYDIFNELQNKVNRFISYGWTTKDEVNSYLKRNGYKFRIN